MCMCVCVCMYVCVCVSVCVCVREIERERKSESECVNATRLVDFFFFSCFNVRKLFSGIIRVYQLGSHHHQQQIQILKN